MDGHDITKQGTSFHDSSNVFAPLPCHLPSRWFMPLPLRLETGRDGGGGALTKDIGHGDSADRLTNEVVRLARQRAPLQAGLEPPSVPAPVLLGSC